MWLNNCFFAYPRMWLLPDSVLVGACVPRIQTDVIECNPLLACVLFVVYLWVRLVAAAPGRAGGRPRVEWRTSDLWIPGRQRGGQRTEAQRAQPQGSEVKRQGLSERAAGWSGPLGIAEDCICVRLCTCMCGEGEGGMWFRFRTLLWLGMLWHCRERQKETKEERKDGRVNILYVLSITIILNHNIHHQSTTTSVSGAFQTLVTRMSRGTCFHVDPKPMWIVHGQTITLSFMMEQQ